MAIMAKTITQCLKNIGDALARCINKIEFKEIDKPKQVR
jgi:hypothetical protein